MYRDWYMFTLKIKRKEPKSSELVGEIQAHSWDSGPDEPQPPPCRPYLDHWKVLMPARGRLETTPARAHKAERHKVFFGGTSWSVEARLCGRAPGPGQYNLDNFSGIIDPERQEFQSVNNDGGRSVNEPTVFRRIGCYEPPPKPHVAVAPPPFWPKERAGGGCGWF
jgi:hypothetical protein